MESNLGNRFSGTLEGLIFAIVLSALYWVIGFLVLKIIKKEIRTGTGYAVCLIGGFVLNRTLPKIFV
jgi:hypothetical protein|tara:strand:- start:588 stop:788 length:201 start_codon:yes stop_codon:yes gene_type:complete